MRSDPVTSRRRIPLALALALSLPGAAVAAEAQAPAFQPPPLYAAPLPTADDPAARRFAYGVRMLGDVTYASIPGYRPLKLDLYLPARPRAGGVPLVIWVHGGGWEIGNPRADWTYGDWTAVLARLAARGYAVAGVSYRLSAEAGFPAQLDDVYAALRFLRANAARWGIDPARVYLWGLSAGGHLAALAGAQGATLAGDLHVQGVVVWFGPGDLTLYPSSGENLRKFLRCPPSGCERAALAAASAITYVSARSPPMLVMQGDADTLVPAEQGRALYERLRAAGVPARLELLPGLGHGFTGASPERQQELLAETFRYIDGLAGVTPACGTRSGRPRPAPACR